MLKSTNRHKKYWQERVIDWKKGYLDTWTHPHRTRIIEILRKINFVSILEVGCASGPNLYLIAKAFNNKVRVGGVDISASAIETAKKHLPPGSVLEQSDVQDMYFNDDSVDVTLSDMTLIYISPWKIKRTLREIKRVTRNNIIFVEFHSKNIFKRWGLALASGYYAHNYEKLLENEGFYDIMIEKIPEEAWPGGEPQKSFGYIITAKK
jgi:ubiquinone/menaquinone biosynthesis C-methylase UbiE|tara:strand:- start:699 stop:1322 length:624 start_codon:yes stop_codon:yes gene_type:complete